jgi:ABC-type sugar transport system ATPase subunit
MKTMSREYGIGFVFSSHSMSAVIELAGPAIVFSDGQVIQVCASHSLLHCTLACHASVIAFPVC